MAARNDFDDFFGDDDDATTTDTRADGRLYRVPLSRLSPNLVNPRTEFGTEDALIDFGKSLARRQNQACPVVSRNAYLKLWPDHRDQVKNVDYILVSGERRFRAATAVGLPALDCIVDDNVAADRRTFMEAVVSENVDRQNFDPIEEAYAVQALVAEFGSNRAVAEHFERVDGWVTQRILLTNLGRDVQDLVRRKTIPLEAARTLGKLARDNQWGSHDQLAWWEDEQARRSAASAARAAVRKAGRGQPAVETAPRPVPVPPTVVEAPEPSPKPESFTAVKLSSPQDAPPASVEQPAPTSVPPSLTLVREAAVVLAEQPIPEPRTIQQPETGGDHAPRTLPYDDGNFIALHLIRKMPEKGFLTALRVMIDHANSAGLEIPPA
jgi:ParB family chromosome partitioning protein